MPRWCVPAVSGAAPLSRYLVVADTAFRLTRHVGARSAIGEMAQFLPTVGAHTVYLVPISNK